MTSPFATRVSGGDYFKPADHANDLAIILEPKKILRNQPHEYEGVKSERDVAVATISCFRTSEDIANETPSVVKDVQITNQVLVADVETNDWVGKVALVTVTKAKRAYVYRDVTYPGAEQAAINYYEKRNAEVADNLASAPDFD